ncbi:MAG TPA: NADH-quinone oxidoreductase subunit L [Acidimicrobiia bacterium]|nr:NADH-quinone oxidoreductase subunit L [Acidimicrobiia bacterium]
MDAHDLLELIWIIPALPAAGAVVLLLFGRRLGEPTAGWLATALMALAFVGSVVAFVALLGLDEEERAVVSQGYTWIEAGGFAVDLRFLVDPLSVTMILFVTGVGTLIHLYSIGYMHGDARFSRFFAYLNLFAASMLVLVLGNSFLVTFLGWEGVGLCSYLLISFWFERNTAAVAGKKAFITNRVGDFGFMLAMFLIFEKLGTLDYAALGDGAQAARGSATAIALLLFVGAVGKSAQLPLHVWLPDAMEGPTPVSALIHAATMVTAGVFLVARAHVFFEMSDAAATTVAWVGVITALFAATVALVQNDIKRVLAYSTISQLGYMFLALGVGAYGAALFHMVTHAFFKALLFLAAGSVIHGLHDEQDMRRMGGLRRYMPITGAVFVVGWLSIAGVFPFSGFWSKDEILAKVWFDGQYALWVLGTVTAFLTAFYMTRQLRLVFAEPARWRDGSTPPLVVSGGADDEPLAEAVPAHHAGAAGEPHESPWTMTLPLAALALLAATGGFLNLPFADEGFELLTEWLHPVFADVEEIHPTSFLAGTLLSLVALAIALTGIAAARALYRRGLEPDGTDPGVRRLGAAAPVLEHAYYLDDALAAGVAGPGRRAAAVLADDVDARGVDGAVNGVAAGFRVLSSGLRRIQTGYVRNYALGLVFGTVVLLAWFGTRGMW